MPTIDPNSYNVNNLAQAKLAPKAEAPAALEQDAKPVQAQVSAPDLGSYDFQADAKLGSGNDQFPGWEWKGGGNQLPGLDWQGGGAQIPGETWIPGEVWKPGAEDLSILKSQETSDGGLASINTEPVPKPQDLAIAGGGLASIDSEPILKPSVVGGGEFPSIIGKGGLASIDSEPILKPAGDAEAIVVTAGGASKPSLIGDGGLASIDSEPILKPQVIGGDAIGQLQVSQKLDAVISFEDTGTMKP